jgi:DNA-binding beta-propeller fold protein YncE
VKTILVILTAALPLFAQQGVITTIAGAYPLGDGGPALNAVIKTPAQMAVDSAGNIYVAADNRLRRIAPDGTISTIAGGQYPGFSGDGGPADRATLNNADGVAVDADDNICVADRYNSRIRRIARSGIITTVVGGGTAEGDGG